MSGLLWLQVLTFLGLTVHLTVLAVMLTKFLQSKQFLYYQENKSRLWMQFISVAIFLLVNLVVAFVLALKTL